MGPVALLLHLLGNASAQSPIEIVDWYQFDAIVTTPPVSQGMRAMVEYRGDLVLAGHLYLPGFPGTPHPQGDERGICIFRDGVRFPLLGDTRLLTGHENRVNALHVDGDRLLIAGAFDFAAGDSVSNVIAVDTALADPVDDLGGGVPFVAHAIGLFDSKVVVARELRVRAAGDDLLWLWDGDQWKTVDLPQGIECAAVRALQEWNGSLWVGGMFLAPGELPGEGRAVAIWDGNSWSWPDHALRSDADGSDGGLPLGQQGVFDLALFDGDLLAVGNFRSTAEGIWGAAAWDGANWSALPTDQADLRSILPLDDEVLLLGSALRTLEDASISDAPCTWNGERFRPIPGMEEPVLAQPMLANVASVHEGTLLLCDEGYHSWDNAEQLRFLSYDGSQWRSSRSWGGVPGIVTAILPHPPGIVFAGTFEFVGGILSPQVARWDGSSFQPMAKGLMGWEELAPYEGSPVLVELDGDPVLGGSFALHGHGSQNVARWDGSRWQPMGSGLQAPSPIPTVVAGFEFVDGQLIAAGHFDRTGAEERLAIARWDGVAWSDWEQPLAAISGPESLLPQVYDLAIWHEELWIGGANLSTDGSAAHALARWDGQDWEFFQTPPELRVHRLHPAGDHLLIQFVEEFENFQWEWSVGRFGETGLEFVTDQEPWVGDPYMGRSAQIGPELWFSTVSEVNRYQDGQLLPVEGASPFLCAVAQGHMLYLGFMAEGYWAGFQTSQGALRIATLANSVPVRTLQLRAQIDGDYVRLICELPETARVDSVTLERHGSGGLWRPIESLQPAAGQFEVEFRDELTGLELRSYRASALVDGQRIVSGVVELSPRVDGVPTRSALSRVAPNPFNPITHVDFALARPGRVRVDIYRVDGRRVLSRDLGELAAGPQSWQWDGRDDEGNTVASGSYVLRILAPDRNLSTRLVLLK